MRMIGRILAILSLALVLGTTGPVQAQGPELRIGVDANYPPFSKQVKGGAFEGFDIEIAKALCDQIAAECRLVALDDFAQVMPDLNAGKYDAVIASMSITPERLRRVSFTSKYYQSPARFVTRRGSGLSVQGLAGKTIGVQRGATHDSFVSSQFGGIARIERFQTLGQAIEALDAGRVDIVMADSLALKGSILSGKNADEYELVGPSYTDPRFFGLGAGIALPKDDNGLKRRLDDAIRAIRANGTYQQIAGKYFPFDIYGQ